MSQRFVPPTPHPSGARPPALPSEAVPKHVAVIMDGNGRWAKKRGLPRTEGHKMGEAALFDVIEGAIELGVRYLSAYAFSTENWRRSPDEVRWLMGFNRDVIHRRRDELNAMGVRIRWAGRRPKLWRSVITELEQAEQMSRDNDKLTLQFCVNYGGRAELVDAMRAMGREVQAGRLNPAKIDERTVGQYLDEPGLPEVLLAGREREYVGWFLNAKALTPGAFDDAEVDHYAAALATDGALRAALAYYRDAAESARKNHVALERGHLTVPVLGISSSHGSIPDMAASISPWAENVTGVLVPDAGHFIPDEQPEAVAAALADFVIAGG